MDVVNTKQPRGKEMKTGEPEDHPRTLYHYCSNSAFKSIVEGRSLRLSDLTLSNDTMEGRLVEKVFHEAMPSRTEHRSVSEFRKIFMSNIRARVLGLGFCLSSESRSLSQWRYYGDEGRGVAIGFNRETLENIAKRDLVSLEKVDYSNKTQLEWMKELLSQDEIQTFFDDPSNLPGGHLLATESLARLFFWKSQEFVEEKEWRLAKTIRLHKSNFGGDGVNLTARRGELVHHLDVKFEGSADTVVDEIILGPLNASTQAPLEQWIKAMGYESAIVMKSELPMR